MGIGNRVAYQKELDQTVFETADHSANHYSPFEEGLCEHMVSVTEKG